MRPLKERHQRRKVRLLVTYWEPGKESGYQSGHLTNLSKTGAYITTHAPLSPPATLNLRLVLNERTVDVPAEVVRSMGEALFAGRNSGSGMGIRFLDPASPDTLALFQHGPEGPESPGD